MLQVNGVTFNGLQQWQVDYLLEHYQEYKMTELMEGLGLSDTTIQRLLSALGLTRTRKWKISIPHDDEALKLLMDPYVSNVTIARKYKCTPEAVGKRRHLLGVYPRRGYDLTGLEQDIRDILDELDLAYVTQKKIGQWSIDFYLGRGYCIDVHGAWAHSRKGMPARDARKQEELTNLGYFYLAIREDQMTNAKYLITEFTSGFPPAAMQVQKVGELLESYGLTAMPISNQVA